MEGLDTTLDADSQQLVWTYLQSPATLSDMAEFLPDTRYISCTEGSHLEGKERDDVSLVKSTRRYCLCTSASTLSTYSKPKPENVTQYTLPQPCQYVWGEAVGSSSLDSTLNLETTSSPK
jgi:hypothetical protein